MRTGSFPRLCLLAALFCPAGLPAQEEAVTQLSKVAEGYVAAYNEKDLDAMLALYTEDAEMIDEIDKVSAAGPEEIREVFARSFENFPDRRISLDVLSVRQIAENVVIEEGVARFSGEVPNEEGDAIRYSATLVKGPDDGWKIASSREIGPEGPPADPLADLLAFEGDWVCHNDQMQTEFSLVLAPSGRFFTGKALVTTPAEGTMETEVRIAYDASDDQIRWWTFDELGGFSEGTWHPIDEGWLIRTEGVTAQGESTSAIQEMEFLNRDTIRWKSTRRFLDGEALPDLDLRLVRRPPIPSLSRVEPSSEPEPESPPESEEPQDQPAPTSSPTPSKP